MEAAKNLIVSERKVRSKKVNWSEAPKCKWLQMAADIIQDLLEGFYEDKSGIFVLHQQQRKYSSVMEKA